MKMSNFEKITILEVISDNNYINNSYEYTGTVENFHQICRLCIGYENIKPIFDMTYNQISIQNLILDFSAIRVEPNDCLPQNICANCLAILIGYCNFREKCTQNENTLVDLYNKNKTQEKDSTLQNKEILNSNNFNNLTKNEEINTITEELNSELKSDHDRDDNIDEDEKIFSDCSDDSDIKSQKTIKNTGKRRQVPPFKCSDCPDVYKTKDELKKHRKQLKHPEPRNHKCSICDKRFTRSKLKQHMRVHTKEKPFPCNICSQAFSMSGNLKRHMMTHTGERPHVCDMCGKGFIQATTLQLHRKTHLSSHFNNKCSTQNISCEICGRGFKRTARYKAHLVRHLPNKEEKSKEIRPKTKDISNTREYICNICKRTYKTKHLLKAHQLTHGEKTYLCSDCGRGFITKAALQSHLKIHTGEKPHTCTVCKKSFAHVGSFEAHMLIHTGRKPYNCKICSKAFTQLSHLKYHSRTHSGEKPYTCHYCGKSFALKGNLTVHVRIHTGETPYLCPVCGKGFYDSSSMKKHQKGHGESAIVINTIDSNTCDS